MPDQPKRIQRGRSKGWRMPENTVYVGRPTIWGNPHDWMSWLPDWKECAPVSYETGNGHNWCRDRAVQAFDQDISDGLLPDIIVRLPELRGKNLAFWCPIGSPCHADVLLKLANAPAAWMGGEGADAVF